MEVLNRDNKLSITSGIHIFNKTNLYHELDLKIPYPEGEQITIRLTEKDVGFEDIGEETIYDEDIAKRDKVIEIKTHNMEFSKDDCSSI